MAKQQPQTLEQMRMCVEDILRRQPRQIAYLGGLILSPGEHADDTA